MASLIISNTTYVHSANNTTTSHETLPTSTSVAIAVCITVILILGTGLLVAWRKLCGFCGKKTREAQPERAEIAEMCGDSKTWMEAMLGERIEMEAEGRSQELSSCDYTLVELEGCSAYYELPGSYQLR